MTGFELTMLAAAWCAGQPMMGSVIRSDIIECRTRVIACRMPPLESGRFYDASYVDSLILECVRKVKYGEPEPAAPLPDWGYPTPPKKGKKP